MFPQTIGMPRKKKSKANNARVKKTYNNRRSVQRRKVRNAQANNGPTDTVSVSNQSDTVMCGSQITGSQDSKSVLKSKYSS